MAEEQEAEVKRSPLIGYAVMGTFVLLVPTVLAVLVYWFVLQPIISPQPKAEPVLVEGVVPPGALPFEFAEAQAAVLPDEPDLAAPLLLYRVAMICKDQATLDLITTRQVYFTAMLDKLHRNRTRKELSDPQVQDTLLKQARQEANHWLRRLNPAGAEEVLEVMYVKFGLVDL